MGGRGGGSPAGRQAEAPVAPVSSLDRPTSQTPGQAAGREITITVVEKPAGERWRIIGDGPDSLVGESGLWVTKDAKGYQVRLSATDKILSRGSSIAGALRNLAKITGIPVNYVDETAGDRVLGRFT